MLRLVSQQHVYVDIACAPSPRLLPPGQGLQKRLDDLAAGLKAGEWEALKAQAEEVARLGAQRRALLVGPASECSTAVLPYCSTAVRQADGGGGRGGRGKRACCRVP